MVLLNAGPDHGQRDETADLRADTRPRKQARRAQISHVRQREAAAHLIRHYPAPACAAPLSQQPCGCFPHRRRHEHCAGRPPAKCLSTCFSRNPSPDKRHLAVNRDPPPALNHIYRNACHPICTKPSTRFQQASEMRPVVCNANNGGDDRAPGRTRQPLPAEMPIHESRERRPSTATLSQGRR